jgi:hypothetical protein
MAPVKPLSLRPPCSRREKFSSARNLISEPVSNRLAIDCAVMQPAEFTTNLGKIASTRDGQNDEREIQFALKLYY